MSGGRTRLAIGETGEMWFEKNANGSYTAKVWRRHPNQRQKRQVSRTAKTKGAAKRRLEKALEEPVGRAGDGVQPNWTIDRLADHWLPWKERTGVVRRGRHAKQQSLAGYDASIRNIIKPLLGALTLKELTPALVENALLELEERDISTANSRTVLNQMLKLALRDGAVTSNVMEVVAREIREVKDVMAMTVDQVHEYLSVVHPDNRVSGKAASREELYDLCVFGLGTGARIGELLAVRWVDLDLERKDGPTVHLRGTVVEPRKGFVATHHRQSTTKNSEDRKLILPDAVVAAVERRRRAHPQASPDDAVFPGGIGSWKWQATVRQQLIVAFKDHPLSHIRPHDWRRSVGTL